MIIRKKFRFEGAHIVRNCSSKRCKQSIHGHSYVVEVRLQSESLDRAGMVYDFGLFKPIIKDFIDSFDHAYSLWSKESDEFKGFIHKFSDRYVEMPISPSAENYALLMAHVVDLILLNTEKKNGETGLRLHSVRVHETETGWAQASLEDVKRLTYRDGAFPDLDLDSIKFSDGIQIEWQQPLWFEYLKNRKRFINPTVEVTHE